MVESDGLIGIGEGFFISGSGGVVAIPEHGRNSIIIENQRTVSVAIPDGLHADTTDAIAYLLYLQTLCGESKVPELIAAFNKE